VITAFRPGWMKIDLKELKGNDMALKITPQNLLQVPGKRVQDVIDFGPGVAR
jgi:hypothetical protein